MVRNCYHSVQRSNGKHVVVFLNMFGDRMEIIEEFDDHVMAKLTAKRLNYKLNFG